MSDVNPDGSEGFANHNISADDLGRVVTWHGAVDPVAGANDIPNDGLFFNTTERVLKINTGTKALPVWDSMITTPVGTVQFHAGDATPYGWLFCDGTAISRADYARLFAVIGVRYGDGDGATTFNLPNMRQRFPRGANDGANVSDTGGESTHTLTIDEMPSHTHDTTLKHIGSGVLPSKPLPSGQSSNNPVDTTETGGGAAHENKPPYIDLLAVIKY